ncbi:MAG: hypothetical protein EOS05_13565 [Mesorhizobium sp.]|nr:MAG: hypothetical protein EOS05_13565 [Mesorhizobium sp.]
MKIDSEHLEGITAEALRLRDVLEILGTRRLETDHDVYEVGTRFKLLASCLEDVGNALCDGVFLVAN